MSIRSATFSTKSLHFYSPHLTTPTSKPGKVSTTYLPVPNKHQCTLTHSLLPIYLRTFTSTPHLSKPPSHLPSHPQPRPSPSHTPHYASPTQDQDPSIPTHLRTCLQINPLPRPQADATHGACFRAHPSHPSNGVGFAAWAGARLPARRRAKTRACVWTCSACGCIGGPTGLGAGRGRGVCLVGGKRGRD